MDKPLLEPIGTPKNLAEIAYERIKSLILHTPLSSSLRLTEDRLSRELGISKTPVREALRRLAAEGLLEVASRQGTYVANLDARAVREIYDLREGLEITAIRLAWGRITDEVIRKLKDLVEEGEQFARMGDVVNYNRLDIVFHDLIISCADNNRLLKTYRNLLDQIQLVRLRVVRIGNRVRRSSEEHRQIVDALASNELSRAEEMMRYHISSAKEDMLALLAQAGQNEGTPNS